jgi:hypothetical protein
LTWNSLLTGQGSGWSYLILTLVLTALTKQRVQTAALQAASELHWQLVLFVGKVSAQTSPHRERSWLSSSARSQWVTLLQLPLCSLLSALSLIINPIYWWLTGTGIVAIYLARQFALAQSIGESDTFDRWCASAAISPLAFRSWASLEARAARSDFQTDTVRQNYITSPFSLDPLIVLCVLTLLITRLEEATKHTFSAHAITCLATAAGLLVLLRSVTLLNRSLSMNETFFSSRTLIWLCSGPASVIAGAATLFLLTAAFVSEPLTHPILLIALLSSLTCSFLFRLLASIFSGSADPHCFISGQIGRAPDRTKSTYTSTIFLDHLELGVSKYGDLTRALIRVYAHWEQAPQGASLLLFRTLVGLDLLAAALVLVVDLPLL